MAAVQIADVIEPTTFTEYTVERTAERSALLQSGVAVRDAAFSDLAKSGGSILNMPHWEDLSGNSEADTDDPTNDGTPKKITATNEKAIMHYRRGSWGRSDLAASVAGDDPMKVIADGVADWWNRDIESYVLVPTLNGMFNASNGVLRTTHSLDVSIADGNNATASNLISPESVIDTAKLLGDQWRKVKAIAVHSVVHSRLQKLGLIETVRLADQNIEFETFLGRRLIETDSCYSVAGGTSGTVYSTYLFGEGTFAWGDGAPLVPTEIERKGLAGASYLINRKHFFLHPRGVSFTGSIAGVTPTNVELATGSKWTKVYETKNIPLLELRTNG